MSGNGVGGFLAREQEYPRHDGEREIHPRRYGEFHGNERPRTEAPQKPNPHTGVDLPEQEPQARSECVDGVEDQRIGFLNPPMRTNSSQDAIQELQHQIEQTQPVHQARADRPAFLPRSSRVENCQPGQRRGGGCHRVEVCREHACAVKPSFLPDSFPHALLSTIVADDQIGGQATGTLAQEAKRA